MKYVFIFESVHRVMKAEKLLKGKGIKIDLIPVPREISSDCGVAIELSADSEAEALLILRENRISVVECYTRDLIGGLSKMEEAGVALVGGHSVQDPEIKYGLAVTGVIHPKKILINAKGKVGDQLVLTKIIGTGIVATALKGGMASEEAVRKIVESMVTLNRRASEWMINLEPMPARISQGLVSSGML